MSTKRILCVGLVCVDVVQVCPSFPLEDTDQRCIEQYWQRGGNASNNCTVLSKLGDICEFFGTISGGIFCGYVTNDFESQNILIDNCVYHDGCDFPLSVIIINAECGSRTIIHSNKNLPELRIEDFMKLDLSCYSWLHFEGRNIQQVNLMIEYADKWKAEHKADFKISVEFEKLRPEQEKLCSAADVVFIGKDYAKLKGFMTMDEAIDNIKPSTKPGSVIISAWGESGATGFSENEGYVFSPANIQAVTLDTLGAGDTFCAAVVFALDRGHSVKNSVKFGCQIAGAKVGISGFKDLKQVCHPYIDELQKKPTFQQLDC